MAAELSLKEYLQLPLSKRLIKLDPDQERRADDIIAKNILFDIHTHITEWNWEKGWERDRVRNSRVDCFWEAVAVVEEDFDKSMHKLGTLFSLIRRQGDMTVAFCGDDIRRAKAEGKQAVMAQLEPQTFGFNLDLIDVAYGLGIRMMLLTFNLRNYVGDGCGERQDSGLSYFGLDAVRKLNEAGIAIDISHCGDRTTLDVAEASRHPIVCSHGGARALNPGVKRLKTDEAIKAIASNGGLLAISAIPNQLSNQPRQGIKDLLDHVDYIAQLVGIEHVAIGLDNIFDDHVALHRRTAQDRFDNIERIGMTLPADYMEGIESPEEWTNIVRGLVLRGYSDDDVAKVIGGNALRLVDEVVH